MKKIILLGDSVRMGYDKHVKEALKGTAYMGGKVLSVICREPAFPLPRSR